MSDSGVEAYSGMRDKVVDILANVADVDRLVIEDKSRLIDDLGLDSVDLVEVADKLKGELGIELSDSDLASGAVFGTVATLLRFVTTQS